MKLITQVEKYSEEHIMACNAITCNPRLLQRSEKTKTTFDKRMLVSKKIVALVHVGSLMQIVKTFPFTRFTILDSPKILLFSQSLHGHA